MLLRCASRPFGLGVRIISTSSTRANVGAAVVSKREDYYKTLGEQVDDSRPPEWDTAKPYEEIPGPKPLPIVGNMWRFMPVIGDLYQIPIMTMFRKLKKEYGNVISFKGVPGKPDFVYIYDPKDIETLLRNAGNFPVREAMELFVHYRTVERQDIFQDVGGVATVQGEQWFKMRSIINPILMQPKTIHQYHSKLDVVAKDFVNNMRHFSKLNEKRQMPGNFINDLYKWALESVGVLAFDKRLGCLDLNPPKDSEVQKIVDAVLRMFHDLYLAEVQPPFWRVVRTPQYKKFVKNMNYITGFLTKNIDEALLEPIDESVPEQQQSFLRRLANKDKKVALAMIMDMMIAGLDTSGKTLGAILYFLARNPEKQAKLREEVFKNLPEKNSPITSEVLGNSPYLKAVVKESNRIAPVAIGSRRTTVKELVLGGYQIPKGTNVTMVIIDASNSAENFKDPEKYLPERWLRDSTGEYSAKNAHAFASLPFGFGVRACAGMRLANMELELVLMNIIRNFELSWEHPDMTFASQLLYSINDPLKVTVKELDR